MARQPSYSSLDLYKRLVAVAEHFGFVSDEVKDKLEEAADMLFGDPRNKDEMWSVAESLAALESPDEDEDEEDQ